MPPQRPPHRPRHRVLTLIIVVLLIAVPAGYVVLSAFQSRDSGEDKERNAAATGLTYNWPSKVQRRIYEVPVPPSSTHVAYYETNSWQKSRLFVQFRTTDKRLDDFLDDIGVSPSELREGRSGIGDRRAQTVGWDFRQGGHTYAGLTRPEPGSKPDLAITVDMTYEQQPRVHVVSTTQF